MMNLSLSKCAKLCSTFCVLIFSCLVMIIGCAPVQVTKYYPEIIDKQSQSQPKPFWEYPEISVLNNANQSMGLTGIKKSGTVPSYFEFTLEVEPPLLTGMHLLDDGSLVCISPLEMQREYQEFVFAKYCSEVFTRVRVIRIDGDNGKMLWSIVLPGKGICDIREINSTLIFQSKYYDKEGRFAESQLIALQKETGKVLWHRSFTKPFVYFCISAEHDQIFFSAETGKNSNNMRIIEGVHLQTGRNTLKFNAPEPMDVKKRSSAWPTIYPDGIMFFENGVSFYELPQGKLKWKRGDLQLKGSAQPEKYARTVYLQSTGGLLAVDVGTGKTTWKNNTIKEIATIVMHTGNHLCVTDSKKGRFSKTHTLSLINPADGTFIWNYKTGPILGNFVEGPLALYFTTEDLLIALDKEKGTVLYKKKLPWDDAFSYHDVSLVDQAIIVINEWNAVKLKANDGKLIYHHQFKPLCPIMTTKERMLEQKRLGARVNGMTTTSYSYNNSVGRAYWSSQYNQSVANYQRTGDSMYLNEAQLNYGMTRHAMGQERVMAGIQSSAALIQATMATSMSILQARVSTANMMIYPVIDQVLQNLRIFDNPKYAVRLVGTEKRKQHFIALEFLNLSSGKVKETILSPNQMPPGFITIGSNVMTATEIQGYLPAATFLPHSFLTLVDFREKRIFHYGPGLNSEEYVKYGKKGFLRGRLLSLPLEL